MPKEMSTFLNNYIIPGYKSMLPWALYIRIILTVYGEI